MSKIKLLAIFIQMIVNLNHLLLSNSWFSTIFECCYYYYYWSYVLIVHKKFDNFSDGSYSSLL